MDGQYQNNTGGGLIPRFLMLLARPPVLLALLAAWALSYGQSKVYLALQELAGAGSVITRLGGSIAGIINGLLFMGLLFFLSRKLGDDSIQGEPLGARFANCAFVYVMINTVIFSMLSDNFPRMQMDYGMSTKQVALIYAALNLVRHIVLFPLLVLLTGLASGSPQHSFRSLAARLSGVNWVLWFGYSTLLAILAFIRLTMQFKDWDLSATSPILLLTLIQFIAAMSTVFGMVWAILSYQTIAEQS